MGEAGTGFGRSIPDSDPSEKKCANFKPGFGSGIKSGSGPNSSKRLDPEIPY
jgi:hypothetical protein